MLSGLNAIYDESRSHAAALFNLFLRLLHRLDLPVRGSGDDIGLRTSLGLDKKSENAAFVVSWLGKLFLFSANQGQAKRCPGLNAEECKFLQLYDRKDTWTPTASGGLNLIETKVVAARFLASGAFLDSERFLPALFASADPNSRLSDIGDDMLKRASSSISLEDDKLVEQLFELCLGTGGTDGSLPARLPLQTRVLALLSRSKRSLSYIERGTQIVQEILMPTENEIQNTKHGLIKTGLEASKLRDQVFAFVNWLARISSPAEMRAFAPSLVSQLQGYIKNQGWPRIENQSSRPSSEQLSSRGYCYESIGLLAAACPDTLLLETNLGLLRWLFASLSVDPSGKHISISIEQALSSVLRAFSQGLDCTLEAPLTNLLLYQMNLHLGGKDASGFERVRSTRFVALRFANRCLSYGNVTARLINLISMDESSNDQTEILEEGRKGLDPYWYMISNPPKDETLPQAGSTKFSRYQFPVFFELIEKFFGPGAEWDIQKAESNCTSLPRAYILAVSFCRYILLHHALSSSSKAPEVNSEWERNIDALVLNDGDSRAQIKKYLFQMSRTERSTLNGLEIFLVASMNGLIHQIHGESNISGQCLLELCAMVPDSTLDVLTGKIFLLRNSIFAYQKPTREVAAHIFGLLASREDSSSVAIRSIVDTCSQKIQSWRQATGKEAIHVHGAILAITYYLSRASHRGTMQTAQDELQKKFIVSTLDILNESQDQQLLDAAVVAILEFSLFSALSPRTIPLPHSFSTLTQKLKIRSMSGDEKAILALGYLGMQCDEFKVGESNLHQTLEILFDLHDVKQPEVQFAVGAALTCCSVGWRSKFLVAALDGEGPWPKTPERNKTMSDVLSKVLKHCKTTKPALRQASVIWLLCLVQYCGHLTDVLSQLRNCQSTFKGFLADRESLNQESASRGLTLVYEKGDRSLKDDLIRDLVGSFTGTNAGLAGNVSDETELFEPGALPTGEGSVTTYKDIMSLASEVGDPGLVYRFMSLASNNAIWSSRAAFGRFGLSNILSDSSVDGYLAENPKLYPALFRYRFDPNTNVSNSMNDIWNALVKKPAATIDLYFDSIMDDLLKNILGKEWRVRQASCAAIADLVQGKPLEKYGDYLSRIWEKTFKVGFAISRCPTFSN